MTPCNLLSSSARILEWSHERSYNQYRASDCIIWSASHIMFLFFSFVSYMCLVATFWPVIIE